MILRWPAIFPIFAAILPPYLVLMLVAVPRYFAYSTATIDQYFPVIIDNQADIKLKNDCRAYAQLCFSQIYTTYSIDTAYFVDFKVP